MLKKQLLAIAILSSTVTVALGGAVNAAEATLQTKGLMKEPLIIALPDCNVPNPPPICDPPDPQPAPTKHKLNVPLFPQLTNMWCWAASGQMVMKYLVPSLNVTQCDQANLNFGLTNCCNSPTPQNCINGGWHVFGSYGFTFTQRDWNALSWAELKGLISAGKPVMFAWAWNGGGGHMMVATGWSLSGGKRYVNVNNPWPPNVGDRQLITYETWVGGTGYGHSHWADFYNIRKQPGVAPSVMKLPEADLQSRQLTSMTPAPDDLTSRPVDAVVEQAATRSLTTVRDTVRHLSTPDQITELGFKSVQEADAAVLGRPIQEYTVGLDQLGNFSAQDNPTKLLSSANTTLYPLISNQSVLSSVRIRTTGQTTELDSIGSPALMKMIASLEQSGVQRSAQPQAPLVAVKVPALGLYFLARRDNGVLSLAPVFDVPDLGLVKGRYEPAVNIFARLAQKRSQSNGQPMS